VYKVVIKQHVSMNERSNLVTIGGIVIGETVRICHVIICNAFIASNFLPINATIIQQSYYAYCINDAEYHNLYCIQCNEL